MTDTIGSNRPAAFHGYSAELVASWCGVSVSTARKWKAGVRKPSKQAMRLFLMHRDGRVLPDSWRGWKIARGDLYDPDGNRTTLIQLRGYWLIIQYAAELARRNVADHEHFYRLLGANADSASESTSAP